MNQQIKKKIMAQFFDRIGDLLHQENKTTIEFEEAGSILKIKVLFADTELHMVYFDTEDPNIEEATIHTLTDLWHSIMDV